MQRPNGKLPDQARGSWRPQAQAAQREAGQFGLGEAAHGAVVQDPHLEKGRGGLLAPPLGFRV